MLRRRGLQEIEAGEEGVDGGIYKVDLGKSIILYIL